MLYGHCHSDYLFTFFVCFVLFCFVCLFFSFVNGEDVWISISIVSQHSVRAKTLRGMYPFVHI